MRLDKKIVWTKRFTKASTRKNAHKLVRREIKKMLDIL